jgi:hypothetical protein
MTMQIVAKLDELGKPAWLALVVLAFFVYWPVGFAILAYMWWSGRMGCWRGGMNRWQASRESHSGPGTWWQPQARSSGNRAFDEYRAETLRRLEDEQKEFREFLDRLRMAKDKSEFDQFMAERRNRPDSAQQQN